MSPVLRALLPLVLLAGCTSPAVVVGTAEPPAVDPLYRPRRVEPGRLEYAPDRTTFPPVLTERFPTPTQRQAADAYRRLVAGTPVPAEGATSVRLFACKPGTLDAQTARVTREPGPAVHCAMDLLDVDGRVLGRWIVDMVHDGVVWTMRPVDPPRTLAPWIGREGSPKDRWGWVPFRDRYE